MSFSEREIQQCAIALGYGLRPTDIQPVRDALERVESSSESEDLVRKELQDWMGVDKEIKDAAPYAGASFRSGPTGSTQYFRGERMAPLYRQAKQHIAQLAWMLDVTPIRDIYANPQQSTGMRISRA